MMLLLIHSLGRSATLLQPAAHHFLGGAFLADVDDSIFCRLAGACCLDLCVAAWTQMFLFRLVLRDVSLGLFDIMHRDGFALVAVDVVLCESPESDA